MIESRGSYHLVMPHQITAQVHSLRAVNPALSLAGAVVLLKQLKVQLLSNPKLQMNTSILTVNKIQVTVLPKLHHEHKTIPNP